MMMMTATTVRGEVVQVAGHLVEIRAYGRRYRLWREHVRVRGERLAIDARSVSWRRLDAARKAHERRRDALVWGRA
jgi:hypothetical protein